MAATETLPIELGFQAPHFELPDTLNGANRTLDQLKGEKGTLVFFICNHCPFVKHINPTMVKLANTFQDLGIAFIAISSNDIEKYPADHPDKMKELAEELKFPFPYLYDESQEVAKDYKAMCTPDFSLFDADLKAIYRGQLDSSRPGNDIPCDGVDLKRAMESLLSGQAQADEQLPSIGCNIKWKPGNEPDYYKA